jgi:hypothetical protein
MMAIIDTEPQFEGNTDFELSIPDAVYELANRDPVEIGRWMDIFDSREEILLDERTLIDPYDHSEYTLMLFYTVWTDYGDVKLEEVFQRHPVWDDKKLLEVMVSAIKSGEIDRGGAILFVQKFLWMSFDNKNYRKYEDIVPDRLFYTNKIYQIISNLERTNLQE